VRVRLDDQHVQTELGTADSAGEPTARAGDHQVNIRHAASPLFRSEKHNALRLWISIRPLDVLIRKASRPAP
jgi:hypothetical protein